MRPSTDVSCGRRWRRWCGRPRAGMPLLRAPRRTSRAAASPSSLRSPVFRLGRGARRSQRPRGRRCRCRGRSPSSSSSSRPVTSSSLRPDSLSRRSPSTLPRHAAVVGDGAVVVQRDGGVTHGTVPFLGVFACYLLTSIPSFEEQEQRRSVPPSESTSAAPRACLHCSTPSLKSWPRRSFAAIPRKAGPGLYRALGTPSRP